jgi:hypothetical protein
MKVIENLLNNKMSIITIILSLYLLYTFIIEIRSFIGEGFDLGDYIHHLLNCNKCVSFWSIVFFNFNLAVLVAFLFIIYNKIIE